MTSQKRILLGEVLALVGLALSFVGLTLTFFTKHPRRLPGRRE